MNRKQRAAIKAVGAGAAFAVTVGDLIDAFAQRTNHPAWYAHYPTENLVTLNFGQRETLVSGREYDEIGVFTSNRKARFYKPSDAIFKVELTEPHAKGVNVTEQAAALLLQQIRSIATTTAPYVKDDVKRLLIGCRSIVALYSELRRQSGEFNITDSYDESAYFKYIQGGLPDVSYATKSAEMAEFRAIMGAITPLIRNLIPVNIDLMERTKWLFSNIFADSPSAKFSTKQFYCNNFPMYDENGELHIFALDGAHTVAMTGDGDQAPFSGVVTHARIHIIGGSLVTAAQGLKNMIAFLTSQSMPSRILGDILKAFGEKAFMDFPDFEPAARTPIVYDEDVLNQIQNLAIMPIFQCLDLPGEYRTANSGGTSTDALSYGFLPEKVVTTYRDVIPSDRLLSLTRLTPYGDMPVENHRVYDPSAGTWSTQARTSGRVTSCGTEIVTQWSYFLNATGEVPTFASTDTQVGAGIHLLTHWAMDDWAPALFADSSVWYGIMLDAQNWAEMNEADAATYHTYASLSLMMIHELVRKADTFVFVQ